MMSMLGSLLLFFEKFWTNIRLFGFRNKTVFEIFFIFLYAFEQVLLIWFTYTSKNLQEWGFIISLFAVIVLTTFALQKIVMESRIRMLETIVQNAQYDKKLLEIKNKQVISAYDELARSASKNLYREKDNKLTRRR